ncbi:MAG: DUF2059 domain-containing protein [Proteobacteria bacterium]|nr:DUF2059 domain-containing protein [Pseudomonadota bacterium]
MYRLRIMLLALVFFALAGASSSHAETEKQEAIAELLKITNSLEMLEEITISTLRVLLSQQYARHPEIPDKVKQKTFVILEDTFRENMSAIISDFGKVYAKEFTLEEIQGLIAFYQTDLGQKVITSMPKIMQQGMIIGAKWGREIGLVAMERIQKELASKGYKI